MGQPFCASVFYGCRFHPQFNIPGEKRRRSKVNFRINNIEKYKIITKSY
jgi:hypothetical protein